MGGKSAKEVRWVAAAWQRDAREVGAQELGVAAAVGGGMENSVDVVEQVAGAEGTFLGAPVPGVGTALIHQVPLIGWHQGIHVDLPSFR